MILETDPGTARRIDCDSHRFLAKTLAQHGAKRVIDLGCGSGETAAYLASLGHQVTGIDPMPGAIAEARCHNAPGLHFAVGRAEEMTATAGPFDAALFVNALHHVDPDRMEDALAAALALLSPGGCLLVIEPLAEGSFFEAMRAVEDETAIRAEAVAAVGRMVATGRARLVDLIRWDRISRFAGVEGFLDRLVSVDPARAALVAANRAMIGKAWAAHARAEGDGFVLVQPIVCWHLAPPR
ncbi:MAG: class I SAM-dependent methyltransferase [Pseudorhodobacter sp.]